MSYSINIVKAQECAASLKQVASDVEAASAEAARIAHEIGMDSDDILTQKGYEDMLNKASGYFASRKEDLQKIAATLEQLVELTQAQEGTLLKRLDELSTSS